MTLTDASSCSLERMRSHNARDDALGWFGPRHEAILRAIGRDPFPWQGERLLRVFMPRTLAVLIACVGSGGGCS